MLMSFKIFDSIVAEDKVKAHFEQVRQQFEVALGS